ncbi:MAG: polyketide cyclase [Gallionellaceae bacterium]|nr:MAG: polyketide cyclase [Gallionellaceae bacterium]
MLIKSLIVIALVIAAILIYAATRPDTFRVERSATFKATPAQVFAQINDFHNWPAWSAWERKDPGMKKTHSGAASGVGAVYAWEGNQNVGKGSMTLTESIPNQKVQIKLDFISPFEGHNMADLVLQPQGDGTQLVWSMYGTMAFVPKVMGLFFDMDKMIGKDFEDSLNNLRAVVEK